MDRRSSSWQSLPGAGLSVGAGAGGAIGVLVAGVPGMLLGAGIGAVVELLAGAAARSMRTR